VIIQVRCVLIITYPQETGSDDPEFASGSSVIRKQTDRQSDGQADGQTGGHTDGQADGHTGGHTDGQADGQTGGHAEAGRRAVGQVEKQTDSKLDFVL
jgi:hypothetical protein